MSEYIIRPLFFWTCIQINRRDNLYFLNISFFFWTRIARMTRMVMSQPDIRLIREIRVRLSDHPSSSLSVDSLNGLDGYFIVHPFFVARMVRSSDEVKSVLLWGRGCTVMKSGLYWDWLVVERRWCQGWTEAHSSRKVILTREDKLSYRLKISYLTDWR